MKRIVSWKWLLLIVLSGIMFLGMRISAEAKYNGGIVLDENEEPVKVEKGLMPSKGEVNALVILVEFQDVKHDPVHTAEYMKNIFVGNTNEQEGLRQPVSVREYYQNASYGQLNISGDVYGWYTAEHERSYYGRNDLELPGDDMLFREVVTALNDEIDYSLYDSDDDGYIDAIYLVYAGQTEGWGNTFWTYVSTFVTEELVMDGINLRKFCFANENEGVYTLSHETGHMLGLMDYYDYEKGMFGGYNAFGTDRTLMSGSMGELDALSKILLGWIVPQKITEDADVELRPINEYADAAIVYPTGEADNRTFFLIEGYSGTKNFYDYFSEQGLRIYRVNTELEVDERGFLYGVKDTNEVNTIAIALDTIYNQKELTPYNTPSSYLLEENADGEVLWKATGITIDNFVYRENGVSCSVGYKSIDNSKKLICEINPVAEDNRIYLELNFGVEVKLLDETLQVSAVSGKESIPMVLMRNNYSSKRLDSYYVYTDEKECEPNTIYTITIPTGSFQSTYGAKNEAISYTLCTSDFPEIIAVDRNSGTIDSESEIMPTQDGGLTYFCVKDEYLQKVYISGSGNKEMNALMKLENVSQCCLTACQLEDGDFIVHVYDYIEGSLYRIDKANNCSLLKKGMNSGSNAELSSLGSNAVLYNCINAKYFLIDKDDAVNEFDAMYPYNTGYTCVYKLWDGIYLAAYFYDDFYYIVDSNMNVVKILNNPGANYLFCAMENDNGFELVASEPYNGGEDVRICAFLYDRDYNYIGKKVHSMKSMAYMQNIESGYIVGKEIDRPFYNVDGQGWFSGVIASPILNISFFDNDENALFSYTVDYAGVDYGDFIADAIQLSDERFAFATDWQIYITKKPQMVEDINLNKKELKIEIGEEETLSATILPDNAKNKNIVWKSSDTSIATVDSNGKVTALKVGSAVITAVARDGSGVSQSCTVIVCIEKENPFYDVYGNQWYYKFVKSAYDKGFMSGKKNDEATGLVIFQPSANMARAEFVQVLNNMEGKPQVEYTNRFTDIPSGEWYTNAVLWAAQNGITSGNPNGSFGKYENITREQMALMLMKYAKLKGYDVDGVADLSGYTDATKVSGWAEGAISWAVANGIITGTGDGRLNPQGPATRAEATTMLCKFFDRFQ